MIHPNGHNDNGNAAVIQEPAENEARDNEPLPPDANAPLPGLATRARQRARQQIQQNRFVIIGAGAIVIALLIFVATSMPHRGVPQKVKSRGATASEDLALESGTASNDKSLFPITDSGRPVTKEPHEGFLNERDLQRTATKPAAGTRVASGAGTLGSIPPFGDQQPWQAPPYQPGSGTGAGAETPDLGKAEREAMEKSSLIYVRNVSASSGSQVKDPKLRSLQVRYDYELNEVGRDILAAKFDYPFYLSPTLDLDQAQQQRASQRSLRFENYDDRTVMAITGNYFAAYSEDKMNGESRARESFLRVVLPILKAAVPRFQSSPDVQGYAVEISHHVLGSAMGVAVEQTENLMVFLPQTDAIRLVASSDTNVQQQHRSERSVRAFHAGDGGHKRAVKRSRYRQRQDGSVMPMCPLPASTTGARADQWTTRHFT